MGLFSKKKVKVPASSANLPALPELPKLPDLPSMKDNDDKQIHKLPSFPSNSLGKKFSQDTIKGAVAGEEESDTGKANDFVDNDEDEDEMQMMPEPLKKPMTREVGTSQKSFTPQRSTIGAEPVFIRVDKFESAMQVFNDTRKKIDEIEKILGDLKALKDKEDQELNLWESEIMTLKDKIEKVDSDIFSKI